MAEKVIRAAIRIVSWRTSHSTFDFAACSNNLQISLCNKPICDAYQCSHPTLYLRLPSQTAALLILEFKQLAGAALVFQRTGRPRWRSALENSASVNRRAMFVTVCKPCIEQPASHVDGFWHFRRERAKPNHELRKPQ